MLKTSLPKNSILGWLVANATLLLMLSFATLLMPSFATAAPVTYELSSGSAAIRSTLAGGSNSIFAGSSVINAPIRGVRVVIDQEVGANGRLQSLRITLGDLNINLDSTQVPLSTLNIFSPTISSLGGSDLNGFGQFALQTRFDATATGTFPGGTPFGPEAIAANGDSGSATGMVSVSGDSLLIQIVGVTVASIDQIGNPDPNAPAIEVKADFTFVGQVSNPIPEPSAALLFMVGATVAGSSIRRVRA